MDKVVQKQSDGKGGFLSGFFGHFPSWSILVSAVFGYWSIFYTLRELQGRHLFILTLSDASAAIAVFVGHAIFFVMFFGMLFIIPYGLVREIAVKKCPSDMKWGVFAIFFFFLVIAVILFLVGFYVEKYGVSCLSIISFVLGICIWCYRREEICSCLSKVKLLWCLLFLLVIGNISLIMMLLVVGKDSSDDLNWKLAMSMVFIWGVFLGCLIWQLPKWLSFLEGVSFLSIFIMLAVFISFILGGFAMFKTVYPWLGIIQTKNDARLYMVRGEFFDNQVTKNRFSHELLDKKKGSIKKEGEDFVSNLDIPDIKNYFDKPLKGYLAWNLGDTVIFCEAPDDGKSYDGVLIDCRAASDKQNNLKDGIDLSKGLMIERKYLQMLPK